MIGTDQTALKKVSETEYNNYILFDIVFKCTFKNKTRPLLFIYSHSSHCLRPNVHTIHPKFYVILVIFNTI